MATRQDLLTRLALARKTKAEKNSPKEAPKPEQESLARDVPTDGQRELASACAKDAMVMGWDKSIQKHAYENQVSEQELRRVLDQALEYNDKADPGGRILELEDYRIQKQGRSQLKPRT